MTIKISKFTDSLITIEVLNLSNNYNLGEIDNLRAKFLSVCNVIEYSPKKIVLMFSPSDSLFYTLLKTETSKDQEGSIKSIISRDILSAKSSIDMFLDSSNSERNESSLNGNGFIYYTRYNEDSDSELIFYIEKDLFVSFFNKTFVNIFDLLDTSCICACLETERGTNVLEFYRDYDEVWSDTFGSFIPKKDFMFELNEWDLENAIHFYFKRHTDASAQA